jgi:hypothetical protein
MDNLRSLSDSLVSDNSLHMYAQAAEHRRNRFPVSEMCMVSKSSLVHTSQTGTETGGKPSGCVSLSQTFQKKDKEKERRRIL